MASGTAELLERISEGLWDRDLPLVAVDSPPGAGKTSLVVELALDSAARGRRVAVITPNRSQASDVARRLVRRGLDAVVYLHASDAPPPEDLRAAPGVVCTRDAGRGLGLADRAVVVATVAKMAFSLASLRGAFDVLVCDEAYQVPFSSLAPAIATARRLVIVGDPGQLPPVTEVDTTDLETAPYRVHHPAPRELLRLNPGAPRERLPVTRRLPADTVGIVQPVFYPDLPFTSAAPTRRLAFATRGVGDPVDDALDALAMGMSVVFLVLPPRRRLPGRVDHEVVDAIVRVVHRFLQRGPRLDGTERRPLGPADVGCVDPHVSSGAAIRRALLGLGIPVDEGGVLVDTADRWQGLERPLMVVAHPLSGLVLPDEFHVHPGRMCVMLTRHLVGCVVVTRDGLDETLAGRTIEGSSRPVGARDVSWEGWRAHSLLWERAVQEGRVVRATA